MVFVLGLIASVFVVILSFTIQRKNIVFISSLLAIATIAQYALLGKYSTMLLGIITLVYGVITIFEKRFPIIGSIYALPVLSIVYSAVFFLANGFHANVELIAYLASLTSVLIMAVKNPLFAKWLMFANGIAWVFYQVHSGAYGQLPGEAFYSVGVIFSLVMLYRAKFSGKNLRDVPEFSTILKNKISSFRNNNGTMKIDVNDIDSVSSVVAEPVS